VLLATQWFSCQKLSFECVWIFVVALLQLAVAIAIGVFLFTYPDFTESLSDFTDEDVAIPIIWGGLASALGYGTFVGALYSSAWLTAAVVGPVLALIPLIAGLRWAISYRRRSRYDTDALTRLAQYQLLGMSMLSGVPDPEEVDYLLRSGRDPEYLERLLRHRLLQQWTDRARFKDDRVRDDLSASKNAPEIERARMDALAESARALSNRLRDVVERANQDLGAVNDRIEYTRNAMETLRHDAATINEMLPGARQVSSVAEVETKVLASESAPVDQRTADIALLLHEVARSVTRYVHTDFPKVCRLMVKAVLKVQLKKLAKN